jgi:hypothetical protein
MKITKNIKKILTEKLENLSEYQKITESALNYSEFADVLSIIDSRDDVINAIINIDSELNEVDEETKILLKNACNFGELAPEEQEIFSLSLSINTVISHIKALDAQLIEKIELDKQEVAKQIREQNQGQNAKAARYFKAGMRDEEVEIVRKI